jgi:hypothetical protein
MSGTATKTTEHKARKRHACSWCDEAIEIGEQYKRYRYFNYGDAGTVKMHPECHTAMIEESGGHAIEWSPGEFERPARGEG